MGFITGKGKEDEKKKGSRKKGRGKMKRKERQMHFSNTIKIYLRNTRKEKVQLMFTWYIPATTKRKARKKNPNILWQKKRKWMEYKQIQYPHNLSVKSKNATLEGRQDPDTLFL